jgi:hypothetical protein
MPLDDNAVVTIIRQNKSLERLDLRECEYLKNFVSSEARHLCELFLAHSGVVSIKIDGELMPKLEKLLFDCCNNLEEADVVCNTLARTQAITACPKLRQVRFVCKNLERLALSQCPNLNALDVGLPSQHSKLRTMYIYQCGFGDGALEPLIDSCPSLRRVWVHYCEGVTRWKLRLTQDHGLERLDLTDLNLTSVTIFSPTLTKLTLQSNIALRKLVLDCDNLEVLRPDDFLWKTDTNTGTVLITRRLWEKIVVRSKRLGKLAAAGKPLLRDLELDCRGLSELKLQDFDFAKYDDREMGMRLVRDNQALRAIYLVGVNFPDQTKLVFDHEELRVLGLGAKIGTRTTNTRAGGTGLNAFAPVMEATLATAQVGSVSMIEEVELRCHKIKALFVTAHPRLRRISVSIQPAQRMADLLSVDLSDNNLIGDDTIEEIVKYASMIRRLILRGCSTLSDATAQLLSKHVSQELLILDLSETRMRDPVFELEKLSHLDLANCVELRRPTIRCKELRQLVLNHTTCDVAFALSTLDEVQCTQLRSLWLTRTTTAVTRKRREDSKDDEGKGKEKTEEERQVGNVVNGLQNVVMSLSDLPGPLTAKLVTAPTLKYIDLRGSRYVDQVWAK